MTKSNTDIIIAAISIARPIYPGKDIDITKIRDQLQY